MPKLASKKRNTAHPFPKDQIATAFAEIERVLNKTRAFTQNLTQQAEMDFISEDVVINHNPCPECTQKAPDGGVIPGSKYRLTVNKDNLQFWCEHHQKQVLWLMLGD